MRTARSRTSGENLVDFLMAPSSQVLEPPQKPGRFTVTLRDASGNLVSSEVVQFTTTSGLGIFDADSALTEYGVAKVRLSPATKTSKGADYVVATAIVAGTTLTAQAGFTVASNALNTAVTISSLVADVPATGMSAYGQTNLVVVLAGASPGTPVALNATSSCASQGKATLLPATVTTMTGKASFVLKDNQCGVGSSKDTVTVTVTGTDASKSLDIPVTAPAAASLAYVSASPAQIYLRGSGFTESATVVFQVRDIAGNPLPNQSVSLSLVSPTGDLKLIGDPIRKSDSNGHVTALISSGTVPTPVRVRAELAEIPAINTVSSGLSVAVGLPDQQRFSLAQAVRNIEGYSRDGERNTYTVISSDRMGNPVPDGTIINFVTEAAGQIESSKATVSANGLSSTTVNFQTAGTRPWDGRITILAYALGEESFVDANGNNRWDTGEAFQDLGAPFVRRNFSGSYFVGDQLINPSDDAISNVTCQNNDPSRLSSNVSIPSAVNRCDGKVGKNFVRRALETVLSTSESTLYIFRDINSNIPIGIGTGTLANNGSCTVAYILTSNDEVTKTGYYNLAPLYNLSSTSSLTLLLADSNSYRLNPMAAGTTVSVSASEGITAKVTGGSPVASTTEATTIGLEIVFAKTTVSGTVYVSVKSPSGLTTIHDFAVSTAQSNSNTICTK